MFSNPGEKIIKYSERLFWCNIFIGTICGIVTMCCSFIEFESLWWLLFAGSGGAIIYFGWSYLVSLFISAFGELVVNSKNKTVPSELDEKATDEIKAKEKLEQEKIQKEMENIYTNAMVLYKVGDIKLALELFESIRGYKDTDEKIADCEKRKK